MTGTERSNDTQGINKSRIASDRFNRKAVMEAKTKETSKPREYKPDEAVHAASPETKESAAAVPSATKAAARQPGSTRATNKSVHYVSYAIQGIKVESGNWPPVERGS